MSEVHCVTRRSGFVANADAEFIEYAAHLLRDPDLRGRMERAAREQACGESCDEVFEKVYEGHQAALPALHVSVGQPFHRVHMI